MSTLNYYRRYQQDGTCMVICTRCFLTIGIARGQAAVKDLESRHVCSRAVQEASLEPRPAQTSSAVIVDQAGLVTNLARAAQAVARWNPLILAVILVLVLYALPTLLEYVAAQHWNPWLAVILPGDALGCAALIVFFKMRRTGPVLYLALTGIEGAFYLTHILSPPALLWIVDLIPTLIALSLVSSRRLITRPPRAATS